MGEGGSVTGLVGSATGTQVGNADGRNLASAIDFDVTTVGGNEFIVVTEAREFNSAGGPPALPALQSGSVSVYQLNDDGTLTTTTDDFATGDAAASPFAEGNQLTACWIDFGADGATFYVSNAITSSISSFILKEDGTLDLLETVAAEGVSGFANGDTTGPGVFGTTDGFIDLDVSSDGEFLYQLEGLSGNIGVYSVDIDDASLTLLQEVEGFLPSIDTQGIVSVTASVPEPAGWLIGSLAVLALLGLRRRRNR